ncbi:hypothetical protein [Hymenobacter sp. UYP22]|uniref:hypothetical protein n=1 Tax=Hymenobacter sp. UYP22 TaxID=3156348 RepID=UPI003398BF6E
MISHMGWSRLAAQYAVAAVPATVNQETLTFARIGVAKYNNAARIGFTVEGLYLSTWKIFFAGHPPLFIPWAAFGPVQTQTFLWTTTYTTHISTTAGQVPFAFSSNRLVAALSTAQPTVQ